MTPPTRYEVKIYLWGKLSLPPSPARDLTPEDMNTRAHLWESLATDSPIRFMIPMICKYFGTQYATSYKPKYTLKFKSGRDWYRIHYDGYYRGMCGEIDLITTRPWHRVMVFSFDHEWRNRPSSGVGLFVPGAWVNRIVTMYMNALDIDERQANIEAYQTIERMRAHQNSTRSGS